MAYTNNSMLIEASELFEKLESENTIIKVDRNYFRPREDYGHWSGGSQRSQ